MCVCVCVRVCVCVCVCVAERDDAALTGLDALRWKDRFCAFVATACTMEHYMGIYQIEDRSVKGSLCVRARCFVE